MALQNFSKTKGLEQEKEELSTGGQVETGLPLTTEKTEVFSPAEGEKMRQEVLQELERNKPTFQTDAQAGSTKIPSVPLNKSETLIEIENILEGDLGGVYFQMEPKKQAEFKVKGEKTAREIEKLLQHTKIKAKSIFRLILDWLKVIPGVNKFFLNQEAKIKTDQIIKIKNKEKFR